jgi:hypothetical protein
MQSDIIIIKTFRVDKGLGRRLFSSTQASTSHSTNATLSSSINAVIHILARTLDSSAAMSASHLSRNAIRTSCAHGLHGLSYPCYQASSLPSASDVLSVLIMQGRQSSKTTPSHRNERIALLRPKGIRALRRGCAMLS